MVDTNWRIPVDQSDITTEVPQVSIGLAIVRMLSGFVTLIMLGGLGVLGIAYFADLDQIGWRDSCGISFIMLMMTAFYKAVLSNQRK